MRFLNRANAADTTLRRRRRGQALIVVVVALPLLIGMAALSVTLSTVYFAKAHLQNTVDAAALAGAQEMTPAGGGALNQQILLSQIAENDPGAQSPCIASTAAACGLDMTIPPNAVVATAVQEVPATFAGIFGLKDFTVRATAVAQDRAGGPFDFAIFQGDTAPSQALTINGGVSVLSTTGTNANIHSNDNIDITGEAYTVEGACNASGSVPNNSNCQSYQQGAPILGMPTWTIQQLTSAPNTTVIGSCTNPVNNYPVSGTNFVGGNLVVYGSVTLSGDVTATGSIVAIGGNITLNGHPSVNPGSSGVGVVLAAMPASAGNCGPGQLTSNPTVVFNGKASVTGIVYAPAGQVTINGGGSKINVTGSIVAKDVTLHGDVSVTYSPQQQEAVPVYQVALIR